MKKIGKIIMLALTLVFVAGFAAACGEGGGGGSAKTYTFEAEGVNFSGLSGFGYSINVSETDMIMGRHTPGIPDKVKNSLSSGYFVGYFNTPETTLTFNINADKASENNTLVLRLGSEYGTLNVTPAAMNVIVNETALTFNTVKVIGSNMNSLDDFAGYTVPFQDYTLSSKFALKEGENTIQLVIKTNTMGIADTLFQSVGPGVDCIKIKSESALTWESLWEDNKLEAGIQ